MSKITVVSYCHEAHKPWIPFWAKEIAKQEFQDFRVLFIAHNWSETMTTAAAMSNYNTFHNIVKNELGRGVTFMSHNGTPVIGDVIDFAASKVKTEFMAHWDVDDVFHPKRLLLQSQFLEAHPDVDFLNGRAIGFYGEPPEWPDLLHHPECDTALVKFLTNPKLQDHDQIKDVLLNRGINCLAHGLMVYRPEVLLRLGGFSRSDVKLDGKSPDFETWKKALRAGYKFHRLPELLMMWRLDSSSIRK